MKARTGWITKLKAVFGERRSELFAEEPALLFRRGHMMKANLLKHGVREEDLLRAMAAAGHGPHEVEVVLLRGDGSFSFHRRERAS